jgi:arylsulfatase A-like enzyme
MSKPLDRRKFISSVGGGLAALSLLGCAKENEKQGIEILSRKSGQKPKNVIFILSDDHRYDFMGFMGKPPFLKTPNMDKMAAQGAHLENAFVSTSLCSPSRASVLTGMYAHKHKVVDNQSPVKDDLIYFPQYLQQAGYKTAFLGKWHMGEEQGDDNPRKGFDKWISFKGQGEYFDPELNIDGKRIKKEGYITDILTDYALDWLEEEKDNPFFLYLSHKAVHAMFKPSPKYKGKYANEKVPHPASMANTEENYKDKPTWVRLQRNSWHGVDYMYYNEFDFDDYVRRYCETLLSVDDSIGRVLDYLEKNGLAEDTVVMYMGDNGLMMGEHGLIDKRQMYEESIRVPLLAYAPGYIKPGTKVKQMVQNIDIAPTILDMAGLNTPNDMDGSSFLPLLRGKETKWKDKIFYEYYWERAFPMTPTTFGIRTDQYKYIYYWGVWDMEELYDLKNDPNEMHNLIHDPKYKDMIKELNNELFTWLEKSGGNEIPVKRMGEFIRDGRNCEITCK